MKTNKLLYIIGISVLIVSCNGNYGFILDDTNEKPLQNVLVKDIDDSTNYVFTNKEGKFKFSDCGDLIISKKGFKTDTLPKYGCRPNMKCFNGHFFYMIKCKVGKNKKCK
jgi:hypothetical protein